MADQAITPGELTPGLSDTESTPRPKSRHHQTLMTTGRAQSRPVLGNNFHFHDLRDLEGSKLIAKQPGLIDLKGRQHGDFGNSGGQSGTAPQFPDPNSPQITLLELLSVSPPVIPPVYERGKLQSTRGLTNDDYKLSASVRLRKVVPYIPMLEPMIHAIRPGLANITLSPADHTDRDWMHKIHPASTSFGLPQKIQSEKDTEAWALSVLLRPALAALRLMDRNTADESDGLPNLTSCPGGGAGGSVPDVLVLAPQKHATIEVKTHAALKDSTEYPLHTFHDLLHIWAGMPLGHAVNFAWPHPDQTLGGTANKILAQVSRSPDPKYQA